MTKPTVGQEVAIQGSYSYDNYRFGYVIAKVTPSGQVIAKRTVDGYEQRFDKDGYEMGGTSSKYHRDRLIIDVDAARAHVSNVNAKRMAAAAINAVRGDAGRYNDKESLLKQLATLTELLEVARLAVEEVK